VAAVHAIEIADCDDRANERVMWRIMGRVIGCMIAHDAEVFRHPSYGG
jgi:hypothetical protein